jgi:hypothetical protein
VEDFREWEGGVKNDDPNSEMGSFFPTNLKEIIATLMPLSILMRKATYHHFNSRCPATLIAKGLLRPAEPRPLLLRFFLSI